MQTHDLTNSQAAAPGATEAVEAVRTAAARARASAGPLAAAGDDVISAALEALARRLVERGDDVLAANAVDHARAVGQGLGPGLLDRLRLDHGRLQEMATALRQLAVTADEPRVRVVRQLDDELMVFERRRPIGVVGANFEARPNVTVDMASQCLKSRNPVLLRTGSAALATAAAIVDLVIGPALEEVSLPADAVQLLRVPDRSSADALVSAGDAVPLVILRGSGESTRRLARLAAMAGVRTLAHADGGGVLYVHEAADRAQLMPLVDRSLDRLGVCNRLNLLLVDRAVWDEVVPAAREMLGRREPSVALSEPPHDHVLGYEWALDEARPATVTVAPVDGPLEAAEVANRATSGLAAAVLTEDAAAAAVFLAAYEGTGAFWNATTRLLDGYKLFAVPETGINVDRLPGPRGPVTFRDLYVRQFVVGPVAHAELLARS